MGEPPAASRWGASLLRGGGGGGSRGCASLLFGARISAAAVRGAARASTALLAAALDTVSSQEPLRAAPLSAEQASLVADEEVALAAETGALVRWASVARDAQRTLADLSAVAAAERARSDGALRVYNAAVRTLAESRRPTDGLPAGLSAAARDAWTADAAMLDRLQSRLADILTETTHAAAARQEAAARQLAAVQEQAAALSAGAEARAASASAAANAFARDYARLHAELEAANARLAGAPAAEPGGEASPSRQSAAECSDEHAAVASELHIALAVPDSAAGGDAGSAPPGGEAPRRQRARATREPGIAGGAAHPAPSEAEERMRAAAALAARSAAERWEAHECAWSEFAAAPPACIRLADVPFPEVALMRAANTADDANKPVVGACMRACVHACMRACACCPVLCFGAAAAGCRC
jgi:hypothetical protein